MNYYLPIIIIVVSNTLYHLCAKSTPAEVNAFASLTVTYLIGAGCSTLLYIITAKGFHPAQELRQVNWSCFALGFAIVGLEIGNILMYKVGWDISIGQFVHSALLALILIFVGYFAYHEDLTPRKILGIVVCSVGLYLINK